MKQSLLKFTGYLLRGYAQIFLGSNIISGALILASLLLSSPENAIYSLLGAIIITAVALLYPNAASVVRSGLFGVNGVLLGYSWILFPELPAWFKVSATISGAVILAVIMVPMAKWLMHRKSQYCLFSVPSIVMVWLLLISACFAGLYDTHFLAGWPALLKGNTISSKKQFDAVTVINDKARSYKEDGLGWSYFFEQNYLQSTVNFKRAITLSPNLADAYDGLGWNYFKIGKLDNANDMFLKAISINPHLADSLDGLGWIAWRKYDYINAQQYFSQTVVSAPLFVDAWYGLSLSANKNGNKKIASIAQYISKFSISRNWQFISLYQILSWILFLSAIIIHSRISGVAVVLAISGLFIASQSIPQISTALGDANFFATLLAVTVALTGQYLCINFKGIIWLILTIFLLAMVWSFITTISASSGIPLLWLPCNVILVITILLHRDAVPIDIAATNAETVLLWQQKKSIADECWKMLNK